MLTCEGKYFKEKQAFDNVFIYFILDHSNTCCLNDKIVSLNFLRLFFDLRNCFNYSE